MKKFFKYSYFLLLCGCLTSNNDGGSYRPPIIIGGGNGGSSSGGNSSGSGGNTNTGSSLEKLSNISKITSIITEENTSRIKNGITAYNKNLPVNEQLFLTTSDYTYINNLLATKTNDSNPVSNIPTRISTIESLESTYTDYKNNTSLYDNYSILYLDKSRDDFEDNDSYANYLEANSNTNINRGSYSTATEYVAAVESYLFNNIKAIEGLTESTDYANARENLNTLLDTTSSAIKTNKNTLKEILSKLDPSITDFPITLDSIIAQYIRQGKILEAIKNVSYIPVQDITADNAISAKASGDEPDSSAVSYKYNSALEDYILELTETSKSDTHKTEGTISFKASDFKNNGNVFIASSERLVSTEKYTFMPELQKYLLSGGNFADEISARSKIVTLILDKVKAGTASEEEKAEFTRLTGITISTSFEDLSDADKQKYNIAHGLLSRNDPNFTVDINKKIIDTVKLGGANIGLSFSDFGMWTIHGTNSYTGDSTLIENDPDNKLSGNDDYYVDYAFASGIDAFKQKYVTDTTLEANRKVKFSGNAIGVATKVGVDTADNQRQDLSGKAVLEIDNDSATGNLNLKFDKWYGFDFSDIDLSSKDGFNSSNVKISDSSSVTGFKFGASPNLVGNLSGTMYGSEENKPSEAVGIFDISSDKVYGDTEGKYNSIKVEGAFGAKK